jgi:hypothetical protein
MATRSNQRQLIRTLGRAMTHQGHRPSLAPFLCDNAMVRTTTSETENSSSRPWVCSMIAQKQKMLVQNAATTAITQACIFGSQACHRCCRFLVKQRIRTQARRADGGKSGLELCPAMLIALSPRNYFSFVPSNSTDFAYRRWFCWLRYRRLLIRS